MDITVYVYTVQCVPSLRYMYVGVHLAAEHILRDVTLSRCTSGLNEVTAVYSTGFPVLYSSYTFAYTCTRLCVQYVCTVQVILQPLDLAVETVVQSVVVGMTCGDTLKFKAQHFKKLGSLQQWFKPFALAVVPR